MKTRGLIDFYLPEKIAYHIKVLIASFFITMFFNMIWIGTPISEQFWVTIGLMIVQLEIFLVIGRKLFAAEAIKIGINYKGKVISRLLMFYLIVFVIACGFLLIIIFANMISGEAKFSDIFRYFLSKELKPFLISWIIGIVIASLIFFYMEWTNGLKREQKLREEKLIFQYETLKNQVNPHFLFNSLNTLASLVTKDPQLSERFITKFSSIYRYILEHKDKDMVSLSEEIKFIEDYFMLQKIRDNGKINLEMHIDEPEAYRILPISLQLLVENALKHNAATKESPLNIAIYLEGDDTLVVENNLQRKMHMDSSAKIGLKNLGERILLVMNKPLLVNEEQKKFIVKLPIMRS